MPPQAMPLTQILRYETHIIIVLCSPERMHSLTVQYALFYRHLQFSSFTLTTHLRSFLFVAKEEDANIDLQSSNYYYQFLLNSFWAWLRNRMQSRKKITAPASQDLTQSK